MKVILLQDVEGLGKAGDLKDVANGYARNYLLPRQLAAGATPSLVANRQQHIAAEQRKIEKQDEQNRRGWPVGRRKHHVSTRPRVGLRAPCAW